MSLTVYTLGSAGVQEQSAFPQQDTPGFWLDVLDPSEQEREQAQTFLGVTLPTLDELWEIETSSRLRYYEGEVMMTLLVLAQRNSRHLTPLTILWKNDRLVTLRFQTAPSFEAFLQDARRSHGDYTCIPRLIGGILENVIETTADTLERLAGEVEGLMEKIFHQPVEQSTSATHRKSATRQLKKTLKHVGRMGSHVAKIKESLVSENRLVTFLLTLDRQETHQAAWDRFETIQKDIEALNDQAQFLTSNITFLLDATLGLIDLEQNDIIKVLTVLSVAFLPPTLIASIYGMNFQHMPELAWNWAYPAALGLMVISALVPIWMFKKQGWF